MDFSVAMSVYRKDDPLFLQSALESVITRQTVKPSEVILVVDGPVGDELNAAIAESEERYPTLKVIRLAENGGLGNALRIAVENAANEIVARMDSDDISLENRFETQLRFFEGAESPDVVGGDISEFVGDEDHIVAYRTVPAGDADIRKYMKKRCPLNHVTVMFRKSAVQKAGGYQDWFCNEDYYLWIRMALNGAVFANTGTTLVNVRTGQDMYARRGGWKYFKSEAKLQKFMRKNGLIGFGRYFVNVTERFILQVLMPNRLRGWVFRKVARKKVQN